MFLNYEIRRFRKLIKFKTGGAHLLQLSVASRLSAALSVASRLSAALSFSSKRSNRRARLCFKATFAFKPFAAANLLAVLHAACCLLAMAMRCTLCCSMPCVDAFLAAGRCSRWRLFAVGVHILLLPKLRACALELPPSLPLGPLPEQPYAKQSRTSAPSMEHCLRPPLGAA
jgi:hypothetical protein